MKNKEKQLQRATRLPILTPIITFVFGLIGAKLMDISITPFFDTSTKAVLIGLLTVGLMSTISLIVITTFARRAEEREDAWLKTIGTPADLVFERAEGSTGRYLLKLIDHIQQASKDDEILIMTQHRLSKPIDGMPQTSGLREEYCSLLLRKVREENVTYRRIICFDDHVNDIGFRPDFVLPWLIEHFREMLRLKKTNPDKISIKVSKRKIGADIFVIPRKFGAVVLDVYDLQTGTTSTNSSFFFHDPPNQQIIEQLHAWFMEIDSQAGTIPVSDISPSSAFNNR